MSQGSPILTAYQRLLTNGRLKTNPAQLALVNQLGQLQHSLTTYQTTKWKQPHQSHQQGMYIYGGVGTGKSRLADLFAFTLPKSITCRRIHFHEFMIDIHTRLHHARSQLNYAGDPLIQIGQQIRFESSVLCFDEFQVTDIADAMILKRLFGSFWNAGGIMVSTSNRHPTDLYLNGLNRPLFIPFIKELLQRCLIWKMEGEHDYRMNDVEQGRIPIFFTDPVAFHNSMSIATNGASLSMVNIKVVMNRSINIHAALSRPPNSGLSPPSRTVVYASFSELCEASLGTSDYHAVCGFAHTIYLDGLRQFAKNELDFVRRLILLIDIAYESRTRVLCLSRCSLSDIFKNVAGISNSGQHSDVDGAERNRPKSSLGELEQILTVKGEGGSSSSMMSTFINEVEWSATGLIKASLASGGAGETEVRFAVGRALSRLSEMGSTQYGVNDDQIPTD